uniref:RGS domain-containing protein n=4 Tax=Mus TaxID=862507 RepID=A0A8C6GZ66_MUSSI
MERRLNPLSVRLTPQGHHATLPRDDTPAAGGAQEPPRGGALRASKRWGSRKSRPLSLGKYRGGACALRPLPGDQQDFGARGRRDSGTRRSARILCCSEGPELAPQNLGNPLHSPMPTPHEAEKQHTGPEEADRPPSMSSHDAAPSGPPSRNPCCLCWCCCCSCSWNQERQRAWQVSRESKLQPLPSCEVCTPPSPEEVQSWAQSFDKLMHSPTGRSVFRAFLRTEYSEENMLFWLACEELKAEANQHVVDEKARLIYEDYVSILSPKEVSLDSRVREGINRKMQEPSPHTFDDAQLQIYTLMHRDSYPRFLTSPTYRSLLLQGAPQSSEA